MKLSNFEFVDNLRRQLEAADGVLAAFEAVKEETVAVSAHSGGGLAAYGRGCTVMLLPVPKQVAVSAAKRERDKIVARLAEYGVEVDPPKPAPSVFEMMSRPNVHAPGAALDGH